MDIRKTANDQHPTDESHHVIHIQFLFIFRKIPSDYEDHSHILTKYQLYYSVIKTKRLFVPFGLDLGLMPLAVRWDIWLIYLLWSEWGHSILTQIGGRTEFYCSWDKEGKEGRSAPSPRMRVPLTPHVPYTCKHTWEESLSSFSNPFYVSSKYSQVVLQWLHFRLFSSHYFSYPYQSGFCSFAEYGTETYGGG